MVKITIVSPQPSWAHPIKKKVWVNFITTEACSPEPWFVMVYFMAIIPLAEEFRLVKYYFIWLVVWNIFYFAIYWEFHHPN